MKIAFLNFYGGVVYRGVEIFVHSLANKLVDFGYDITVYQLGGKIPNSRYKTVTLEVDMDWDKKGSYIPFVNYYSLKIKEHTIKVLKKIDKDTDIIFPTNGQWQSLLCSLWAKINKKKIVISGQSGPGFDDRINLWTFPDVFVSLSAFQKQWSNNANPFVKSAIIPNGVDTKKFLPKKKSNNKEKIILNVSALTNWKRQDLLVKAVSKIKSCNLILVGKGDKKNYLKKLGNKLMPKRLKIVNYKHKDMPQIYQKADLFSFPTIPWESFGIVLVEAMACGLPVVATDDPIRREIVGDAGLFVDPTDADAYAKAIKKALNTNWGDKPRKQAEKFSWDKIALKYDDLFKTL